MPHEQPSLQIRLLGPLEVMVAGLPVVVDTRKALAIVAFVAGEGRPFARDELAAMFWPDADDEAARAGDLDVAAVATTDARETAERAGDRHGAGVAERLIGLVAQARGDLAAARAALERSVELAADDPDPTASIAATTALALVQATAGSVDEAVVTAISAIDACRRIGDRHLEAAVENHLADILHAAGRPDDSMAHLKRAVALFAEVGDAGQEPVPGIWALAAW